MSLFDRFVDDPDHRVSGLIAYGLYKTAKRQWVRDFAQRHGSPPSSDDVAAYTATWTSSMVAGKRSEANAVLQDFADTIVARERPEIVAAALRGSSLKAIGLNIAAAFLYTLILIGIVVVLRFSGVDLLSLASAAPSH